MRMNKSYKFADSGPQKIVSVNGQPLQLLCRTNEREGYTSPDRLALSILSDAVGDDAALLLAQTFQQDVVNHCEAGQQISSEEIQEWKDFEVERENSVQSAVWGNQGTAEAVISAARWCLPRLLRVQKR
ncbi:MAG: DUF6166 domain-containing protein [Limisphaerales bacterium]